LLWSARVFGVLAIFVSASPAPIKGAAILLVLASFSLPRLRVVPIRLIAGPAWEWCERDGTVRPLLLKQVTVWPLLIVLRFRDPHRARWNPRMQKSVVLLPDSLTGDEWRRLRGYLLLSAGTDANAESGQSRPA